MNAVLRDFQDWAAKEAAGNKLKLTPEDYNLLVNELSSLNPNILIEKLVEFLTTRGIKVGGIYKHFKGKSYKVLGLIRDADNWLDWKVHYVEVDDVSHEAVRSIADFLGNHESGVVRFQLVG